MILWAIGYSSLASDGPSFSKSVCNRNEFGGPMSAASQVRSKEFLKISHQFQLGALTTEASHPVTANLSETAKRDIGEALKLLFEVDADVVRRYRAFAESTQPQAIKSEVLRALQDGRSEEHTSELQSPCNLV